MKKGIKLSKAKSQENIDSSNDDKTNALHTMKTLWCYFSTRTTRCVRDRKSKTKTDINVIDTLLDSSLNKGLFLKTVMSNLYAS